MQPIVTKTETARVSCQMSTTVGRTQFEIQILNHVRMFERRLKMADRWNGERCEGYLDLCVIGWLENVVLKRNDVE